MENNVRRVKGEVYSLRAVGAFVLALALAWFTLLAYVVHAAVPPNPIRLPLEKRMYTRYWAPQGWAFFTRDPREEDILLFVRGRDGAWISAHKGPHASPSNYFGLSRASRARGIEVGQILRRVPKAGWQPCKERAEVCLERTPNAGTVRNISPNPTLCGEVGLALQKPVPWAWSSSAYKIVMPSRVSRLGVLC